MWPFSACVFSELCVCDSFVWGPLDLGLGLKITAQAVRTQPLRCKWCSIGKGTRDISHLALILLFHFFPGPICA